MKMKLFNKVRKSFEIAGITLVMTTLSGGLVNSGKIAFAAEYYYDKYLLEGKPDRTGDYEQTDGGYDLIYNDERPDIWVNDNGVTRAIVTRYIYTSQPCVDPILWIGHEGKYCVGVTTYAQNAFIRDGLVEKGGDYIYYCDINRARTTGLGVVHGKYILLCPDMSTYNWGHIMEKGEVWNGVEIETTGQLFFGRDAVLTQDCLNKLAMAGIDISNPIKMTNRIYSRETVIHNEYDYKAPEYVPSKYDYSYEETLARQGWAFNFPSQTGKEEADSKERTQNYINYFGEGHDRYGYYYSPYKMDYPFFIGDTYEDHMEYTNVYDDNVRLYIKHDVSEILDAWNAGNYEQASDEAYEQAYEKDFNNSPYIEDVFMGCDAYWYWYGENHDEKEKERFLEWNDLKSLDHHL